MKCFKEGRPHRTRAYLVLVKKFAVVNHALVYCFHVFMIAGLLLCGILVTLNAIQCEAVIMEL